MFLFLLMFTIKSDDKNLYIYYPIELNSTDQCEINLKRENYFKFYFIITVVKTIKLSDLEIEDDENNIITPKFSFMLIKTYKKYIDYLRNRIILGLDDILIDEEKLESEIKKYSWEMKGATESDSETQTTLQIYGFVLSLTEYYVSKYKNDFEKLFNVLDFRIKLFYFIITPTLNTPICAIIYSNSNYIIKKNDFIDDKVLNKFLADIANHTIIMNMSFFNLNIYSNISIKKS